ncbi:MAG: helix-turn-helix transcriptional regulator [Microthrixaceae bacterium]|nr:helix-turn-helix transcriptional regulator [Microthrixaceae bacterium]
MSNTLSESAFWILTALAPEPLHGYAIMRAAGEASDGRVSLKATTLYASLDRLERDHLVEIAREEVVDGRARRTYRLTEHGGAALAREVAELEARARAARSRLASTRIALTGRTAPATMVGAW